jgi:NAD(P)-dependent dehydrogenase (short-subunit alcohol dehydrogenase family)
MTHQKKTVLIAGHAAGLGEALSARFESGGYTVVPVSRTEGSGWTTDLRDAHATQALFDRLDREAPPLAGMIHNAMQFHRQSFMQTSVQTLQDVWQSMVLTAFNVSQQAIPRLRREGGGSLIFSGASGSLRAGPQFSAFSSAKFALRGLVQALDREHRQEGIHVAHVVIDGLIRSERTAQRFGPSDLARLIEPADLAEQYWQLFHQPRSSWSHEIDVRPMADA